MKFKIHKDILMENKDLTLESNNLPSYNSDKLNTITTICKETTDRVLEKNVTEFS